MEEFVGVAILVFVSYSINMLRFYYGVSLLRKRGGSNKKTHPHISLVIPFKNEVTQVPVICPNLLEINYSGAIEIILVDDNSIDGTYNLLVEYASNKIRVIKNEDKGKKKAIESAVSKANGEWIVVTDADCVLNRNWLNALVENIDKNTQMILGPVFINEKIKGFDLQKIEFWGLQGATAGSASIGYPISANGANMMFKKSAFEEVNPYQNNYHLFTGDDQFLMMAIQEKYPESIQYAWSYDAIVRTRPAKTWRHYFEQRIRWASKGSSYTDLHLLFTGLVVFLTSLFVIETLIYGIYIKNVVIAFGFLLIKLVVDLPIVLTTAQFQKEKLKPVSYILSGLLYPVVVVLSVIGGFFRRN